LNAAKEEEDEEEEEEGEEDCDYFYTVGRRQRTRINLSLLEAEIHRFVM